MFVETQQFVERHWNWVIRIT